MNRLHPFLIRVFYLAISLICLGSVAFAQPEGVKNLSGADATEILGGGSINELALKRYIKDLDTFLLTDEGKGAFPEIADYDRFHTDPSLRSDLSFHALLLSLNPVLQKGEVKDKDGIVRDCVSEIKNQKRYFTCNTEKLPEHTVEFQRDYYALVLHEAMVHAKKEMPVSREIPSEYPISSRVLNYFHKENGQWALGKIPVHPISEFGLWCTNNPNLILGMEGVSGESSTKLLFWQKNGDFVFLNFVVPHHQYQSTNDSIHSSRFGQVTHSFFQKKSSLDIVFRGSSPLPTTPTEAAFQAPAMGKSMNKKRTRVNTPLHDDVNPDVNGSFYLQTADNLVMQSSSFLDESEDRWNKISGTVFISPQGEQDLVECYSLESWNDPTWKDVVTLKSFLPPIEDIFATPEKDHYNVDLTFYHQHKIRIK